MLIFLNWVVKGGLTEKIFEQRRKASEEVSHMAMKGNIIPHREKANAKALGQESVCVGEIVSRQWLERSE